MSEPQTALVPGKVPTVAIHLLGHRGHEQLASAFVGMRLSVGAQGDEVEQLLLVEGAQLLELLI